MGRAREPYRKKSVLPKVIARSVLEVLDLFASANAMHTGQVNNILDYIPVLRINSARLSQALSIGATTFHSSKQDFHDMRRAPIFSQIPLQLWLWLEDS